MSLSALNVRQRSNPQKQLSLNVPGMLFGGNCQTLIGLVSEGRVDGFTSSALVAELEGVLLRPTFSLRRDQVEAIIDLVRQTFLSVSPFETVAVVPEDPGC